MDKQQLQQFLDYESLIITARADHSKESLPYLDLCFTCVEYLRECLLNNGYRECMRVIEQLNARDMLKLYFRNYHVDLDSKDLNRFITCYEYLRNYILGKEA